MKLTLNRKFKKDTYSIGKLYIDGVYFCDTVEDKDRGLTDKDSLEKIKATKVYAKTAIPLRQLWVLSVLSLARCHIIRASVMEGCLDYSM